MKAFLTSIILCFAMHIASAQITTAISPQFGPAIVGGKVFVIAGGDWSIGGDEFRLGLGAMTSITDPKVRLLGTGPYKHNLTYAGITAEYEFELADVTDAISGDHLLRGYLLGGIGQSSFKYEGTGTAAYSNASYYIIQPGIFYTLGEFDSPMMIGLSFRYILAPTPSPIAMRHLTGVNLTYRIILDYSGVFGY